MSKTLRVAVLVAGIATSSVAAAHGEIVNIDSLTAAGTNESLRAGTYQAVFGLCQAQ